MTPFRRIITHTLLAAILLIGVQSAPNPDLARRDDSATSSTSPTSATPTIFSSDAGAVATGANPTSISGSDQSTSPSGVISSTAAVASPSTFIPCRNVSKPVPDNYLCQDFLDEVAPSLSQPDFIKLNPDIGADCSALIANHTYCLEADPDPPSTVYFYSDALNQTVGPIPNAGNPMANQYCATFYYPEDNDTCFQIGQTFGATTAALYFMNVPDILDNCDAYRPYMWYCVKMKYNSPSVNSTQITASDEVSSLNSMSTASVAIAVSASQASVRDAMTVSAAAVASVASVRSVASVAASIASVASSIASVASAVASAATAQ